MKVRNINNPQRPTEVNERKAQARVQQFYGLQALLQTWESTDDDTQARNYAYIIRLRARVRTVRNYILHTANAKSDI